MTRDQAKQKWCPFATAPFERFASNNKYAPNGSTYTESEISITSANRDPGGMPGMSCKCIADGCMMWDAPLNDPDHGRCARGGSF